MPIAPKACWSPSPLAARSTAAVALGFLEALLRERFGQSQPQVGTVIMAAREPVTLQELQGRRSGPS